MGMVGPEGAQLALDASDLVPQVIDHPKGRCDVLGPGFWEIEAGECLTTWRPNRSDTGQGFPKVIKVAWIRFFNITRYRTRC
jgi:hypothetical protein